MRQPSTRLIGAALAVSTAATVAPAVAAAATTRSATATKSFTGVLGSAQRWGNVEVVITVKRTTATNATKKKTTSKEKIVSVRVPVYPNHTGRSVFINSQALPILIQETTHAQSASINLVGGATYTSEGFAQSLQSAILKAKSW